MYIPIHTTLFSPPLPPPTGGWYTGESASVGTMTCQGSHSPINRGSADTPSDHTSTFNDGVCEYCSGMCQDCMCENSAQVRSLCGAQRVS